MINDNTFCIRALLRVTSIAGPGTDIIWAGFICLVSLLFLARSPSSILYSCERRRENIKQFSFRKNRPIMPPCSRALEEATCCFISKCKDSTISTKLLYINSHFLSLQSKLPHTPTAAHSSFANFSKKEKTTKPNQQTNKKNNQNLTRTE